ncbi:ATP-binding protein [Methanobrevibacter smithii]|uniref:ATP-binding protein n=1 Tax=Methanobrevibacter smithii TaxID=2173 RepID=UPI001C02ECE1|nr:ATP-binding protein [Methanobrevibacter smithii]MBT9658110.1 AAA family ATPase [Methanobrevibacter smithii]
MIKRELYLEKIRRLINTEPIKIITGVRRSGKTYLLHSIKEELIEQGISKENIFLISFESQKYNKIQNFRELDVCVNNLIKNTSGKIYLLFDEIQNIRDWEKSINSYRVDFDCDIYITGSNSELLSGELATLIAGRYFHIDVYPFSFKEFLQYKKEINRIDIKNKELQLFNEYVKYGGMPSLQQVQDIDKFSYLEDIYSTILLKDIISRHNLRNAEILNRILTFIISNIGQPVSANGISKYLKHENLKVSADTVLNYLSFSQNACFIHEAKKENLKGKKVLKTNGKYYLVDHGFNQAIIGNDMENTGQILENIVYIELLRKGYDVKVGDINGREVDFVCNKVDRKIYIQVAYLLSGKETVKREFGSLRAIGDDYEKYVLSMDNLDFSNAGIKHMNIIEFLKNDII